MAKFGSKIVSPVQSTLYFGKGRQFEMKSDNPITLRDRYQAGERNFSKGNFCDISLISNYLGYANFQGANLRQANLSAVDFRGVNLSEANLSQSDLRNADLRGACLSNAMLFMASLDGANLQGADLSNASLDIATLAQADLQGANLCGAYLRGIDLSAVNLRGAYFNEKTQFDSHFDPVSVGMRTEVNIMLDDLLAHLNQLSQCANYYLGGMTAKYWERSRYNTSYLAAFQVDDAGQLIYSSESASDESAQVASLIELKWSQLWANQFIGNCSMIVQDLSDIVEQKGLVVISKG